MAARWERTIAIAPYILGNNRQTPSNINLSIETNRSLIGLARRTTLICWLSIRISASSATRDRNRSLAIPKINRHKSSIGYQHRVILRQLPARLNLRQGQGEFRAHLTIDPISLIRCCAFAGPASFCGYVGADDRRSRPTASAKTERSIEHVWRIPAPLIRRTPMTSSAHL